MIIRQPGMTEAEYWAAVAEEREEKKHDLHETYTRGPVRLRAETGKVAIQNTAQTELPSTTQDDPSIKPYTARDAAGMLIAEEVEGDVLPPLAETSLPTNAAGETLPIATAEEDLIEDHGFTLPRAS